MSEDKNAKNALDLAKNFIMVMDRQEHIVTQNYYKRDNIDEEKMKKIIQEHRAGFDVLVKEGYEISEEMKLLYEVIWEL